MTNLTVSPACSSLSYLFNSYISKADVWSLGCILLELVLGHDDFCRLWMTAYDREHLKVRDLASLIAVVTPLVLHFGINAGSSCVRYSPLVLSPFDLRIPRRAPVLVSR